MKKAFTIIELLVVTAIIAIIASMVMGMGGGCSRSEGTRVGTLTKFSYKGILNYTKSWEGDLALEGMVSDGTKAMPNVWSFSVRNKAMADKVESLLGKQVKMRYTESFTRNPLKQGTSYLVTGIELLNINSNTPEK